MNRIFTYGSLMRGLHNNFRFYNELKFIRSETIIGNYVLFTYRGCSYPFLSTYEHYKLSLNMQPFNWIQRVKGEVFEVSDETLAIIDRMEIGAGYKRERLTYLDGSYIYIYLYVSEISESAIIVPNNDWIPYVKEYEQSYWKRCQLQSRQYKPQKVYIRNSKGQFCKDQTLKTIYVENITLPISELNKVIDILKRNNIPFTE